MFDSNESQCKSDGSGLLPQKRKATSSPTSDSSLQSNEKYAGRKSSSHPLKKRIAREYYCDIDGAQAVPQIKAESQDSDEETAAEALASLGSGRRSPSPSNLKETSETVASAPDASIVDAYDSSSSDRDSPLPGPVHAPPISKMMVDHTYTDFSIVCEDTLALLDDYETDGSGQSTNEKNASMNAEERKDRAKKLRKLKKLFGDLGPTRKNSGGVVQPFPEKLMEVLDRGDMDDILAWMPHGRSFIVRQPQVFVKEILPRFFKQSKFMSFTRQLNLWGFKRITKGIDAGAYYHELFLRGRPRLCMRMKRQKIKGTGIKLTPNPDTEPDFYDLAKKSPLPVIASDKELKPLPPLPPTTGRDKDASPRNANNHMQHSSHDPQSRSQIQLDSVVSRMSGSGLLNRHAMLDERQMFSSAGPAHCHVPHHLQQVQQNSHAGQRNSDPNLGPQGHHAILHHMKAAAASGFGVQARRHSNGIDPVSLQEHQHRNLYHLRNQHEIDLDAAAAAEHRIVSASNREQQIATLLRQRAAVQQAQQQQHAVMKAQHLLQQVNSIAQEAPNGNSASVAELKQRLLMAARALDHNPEASAFGSLLGGIAGSQSNGGGVANGLSNVLNSGNNSSRVSSILAALQQTQQVAAAAQQQSALLQQLAQDLAVSSGGPRHHNNSYHQNSRAGSQVDLHSMPMHRARR